MNKKNQKTITAGQIYGEYGDNHDTVVLGFKVCKDGSINLNTDEGRIKLTLADLGDEFGVKEYLGNEIYRIK